MHVTCAAACADRRPRQIRRKDSRAAAALMPACRHAAAAGQSLGRKPAGMQATGHDDCKAAAVSRRGRGSRLRGMHASMCTTCGMQADMMDSTGFSGKPAGQREPDLAHACMHASTCAHQHVHALQLGQQRAKVLRAVKAERDALRALPAAHRAGRQAVALAQHRAKIQKVPVPAPLDEGYLRARTADAVIPSLRAGPNRPQRKESACSCVTCQGLSTLAKSCSRLPNVIHPDPTQGQLLRGAIWVPSRRKPPRGSSAAAP